jgi:hypothetical protein
MSDFNELYAILKVIEYTIVLIGKTYRIFKDLKNGSLYIWD